MREACGLAVGARLLGCGLDGKGEFLGLLGHGKKGKVEMESAGGKEILGRVEYVYESVK